VPLVLTTPQPYFSASSFASRVAACLFGITAVVSRVWGFLVCFFV